MTSLSTLANKPSMDGLSLSAGASANERRRRTYGFSWSSDISIARTFALEQKGWPGGGVLMQTVAPPEAIICSVGLVGGREEYEYMVDRKFLSRITVLQRFPEEASC